MKVRSNLLPAYAALILANLLPVYGAMLGKLFFSQVLYLYWFESVLLIFFDAARIILARGKEMEGVSFAGLLQSIAPVADTNRFFYKAGLVVKLVFARTALLLFYLLFIVAFVFLQVTDKSHFRAVLETVVFRNPFFNAAVIVFMISMTVQLITGFLINGKYKSASPLNYYTFFDLRTIVLHVMIIGVVFIHKFLFEGSTYAAKGEMVYVGIFMLFKTIYEVGQLHRQQREHPEAMPMI